MRFCVFHLIFICLSSIHAQDHATETILSGEKKLKGLAARTRGELTVRHKGSLKRLKARGWVSRAKLSRDYTHRTVKHNPRDHTVLIECLPKRNSPAQWGRIYYWAKEKNSLPLKEAFYSRSGNLIRILWFDRVQSKDGYVIPTRITERAAGNSTDYVSLLVK